MTNRKLFFAFLLILSLLVLACGQETETIIPKTDHKTTLKTVSMFGGVDSSSEVYREIRDEFLRSHPGIMIQDQSRSSDEKWKSEVVSDFAVGDEPDVIQFFTDSNADQLVAMDKFVTIEEIRHVYPNYARDIFTWALEQVANSDGVQRAVPIRGIWEGLFCNKSLFDSYDISIPTDWESFERAVKEFRNNGIIPVAVSLSDVPHYWLEHLLLYASGESEYTKIHDEVPESWVIGLSYFKKLKDMGAFPDNTDAIDNAYAYSLFNQQKAAMILEGSWFVNSVKDQMNTVVVPFPGIKENKAEAHTIVSGLTSGFYITKRCWDNPEKRKAAVDYVMANTGKTGVQKYWEAGGGTGMAPAEVRNDKTRTGLLLSVSEFTSKAVLGVLPTDSRMNPEAYRVLISGIVGVSNGEDPAELIKRALEIDKARRK